MKKTKMRKLTCFLSAMMIACAFIILLPAQSVAADVDGFYWPVPASQTVNQPYGYNESGEFHDGIDIGGTIGMDVCAVRSGTVVGAFSGDVEGMWYGYGNGVVIDHGNGYYSHYAHLDSYCVSSGQWVEQGQKIGELGTTGNSTGPHLHFAYAANKSGAGDRVNVNRDVFNYIYEFDVIPIGPEMTQGAGQTITDGNYWLGSKISPTLFVDPAPGNDSPAGASANVFVTNYPDYLPDACDAWTFTYLNNGFYKITQLGTDMCLDVGSADKHRGANVQLFPWHDSGAQMWSVELTEWGYRIRSKCNSYSLDIEGSKSETGTNVEVWEWNGTKGQLYNLIPYYQNFKFGGSGTEDAPYRIATSDDLRWLAHYVNNENTAPYYRDRNYIQTADIDMTGITFTPIGTPADGHPNGGIFSGSYDGQKHSITGLKVDRSKPYNGLFGRCHGGTIKNLSVSGSVTGQEPCGGIVGELKGGSKQAFVNNCSFNGTVTSTNGTAGGIAGLISVPSESTALSGSWVTACYFNGTVSSSAAAPVTGGIVGTMNFSSSNLLSESRIAGCYAVSTKPVTGGMIGVSKLNGSQTAERLDKIKANILLNYYLDSMAEAGITGDISAAGIEAVSAEKLKSMEGTELGSLFVRNRDSSLNDGYPVFEWQQTAPAFTFGDVNDDGSIDLKDVTLMRRALAGWDVTLNKDAADANNDGSFDLKDVVLLRRYLAGGWNVQLG